MREEYDFSMDGRGKFHGRHAQHDLPACREADAFAAEAGGADLCAMGSDRLRKDMDLIKGVDPI